MTPVEAYRNFYPAEEAHQDYYKKHPLHYAQYKRGSGRKAFIEKHWGDQA
ncbi:peptide-methionine (S)-S-oxide reductase [Weissella confusa]